MLHLHATSKPSPTINRKEEPAEDLGGESPLHTVYVSAFYMDEYLVTKSLWDAVKAWNAGNGYSYDYDGSAKAGTHPVQTVDWYDVVKWCNARSKMEGLTPCYYTNSELTEVYKIGQVRNPYVNWSANGYRLPTEAAWEKAARGGVSGHRFPWPDTDTISQSRANYCSYWSGGIPRYLYDVNSTNGYHPTFNDGVVPYTSPVGYFPANGYGLYDMAGNVWEWCWDWFLFTYYSTSPQTDPRGPADGAWPLHRGSNWQVGASNPRCASRGVDGPSTVSNECGFRCARAL